MAEASRHRQAFAPSARAGTCRIYNNGGYAVQSCDNGYFETRDRYGRMHYGIRNGGFERYPSPPARPVFSRRDER